MKYEHLFSLQNQLESQSRKDYLAQLTLIKDSPDCIYAPQLFHSVLSQINYLRN